MDLLSAAYGATGEDDDEDTPGGGEIGQGGATDLSSLPPAKRPRWNPNPYLPTRAFAQPSPAPDQVAHASGRYVSKRERALLLSKSPIPSDSASPRALLESPVVGSISDSNLRADILPSLLRQEKPASSKKVPSKLSITLKGHTKAVNSIHWSQSHGHLLASAGMDQTVHVWNVWSKEQTNARVFKYHGAAVKDVRWSPHGPSLLSGGFDCSLRLIDVEKGKEIKVFKQDQAVEAVKFNPSDSNLFLSGGSKGALRLWDTRSSSVAKEYHRHLGTILDIEFNSNGKQFICSTDTTKSNISENSIIIWDVSREVYTEAFTCPCVRYHPHEPIFVAQSNGNYIAIFSASPPFKLNRFMRYEGHGVWGFPIKCNFSLNGKELASGSSDGNLYFYDYKSSALLRRIEAFKEACTDVAYHPVMPNVLAACSWTGEISIME